MPKATVLYAVTQHAASLKQLILYSKYQSDASKRLVWYHRLKYMNIGTNRQSDALKSLWFKPRWHPVVVSIRSAILFSSNIKLVMQLVWRLLFFSATAKLIKMVVRSGIQSCPVFPSCSLRILPSHLKCWNGSASALDYFIFVEKIPDYGDGGGGGMWADHQHVEKADYWVLGLITHLIPLFEPCWSRKWNQNNGIKRFS